MNSEDHAGAQQQNDELRAMWYRWMLAALALLRSRPPVTSEDYDVTLAEMGSSVVLGPPRPIPELSVDAYSSELTTDADFLGLAQFIVDTPTIASGLLSPSRSPSVLTQADIQALWRIGKTLLLEYLAMNETMTLEREQFDQLYGKLEDYIFHPGPFPTVWQLHLQNVSMEPDIVELENGLALRKLPPDERIWLIKQEMRGVHVNPFRGDVQAIVEYRDVQDKWSSALQIPPPAITAAHIVVLALRLLNVQPVGITGYHFQPVDQPFLLFPRHSGSFNFNEPPMAYFGAPYVLTSSDADRLTSLWPNVRRVVTDGQLTIALNRLADSYLRTKEEDRLIDYWIALESLFVPKGSHQSQQATLAAWAVAHYLGTTTRERASITSILEESHKLRNDIIHADNIKRAEKIREMVTKTGGYLRAALRKRIQE